MARPWSVLILSRYTALGASSRLRALQFIPFLQAAGARVDCSPLFGDDYISQLYAGKRSLVTVATSYARRIVKLAQLRRYDVIWIEKELFPYLPKIFDRALYRSGVPVIIDFDDAIFHNYDNNRRPAVRRIFKDRLDRLLAHAAVVTVGNSYLEDYVIRHGARQVRRLPTVVDTGRYGPAPPSGNAEVRIVWIGSPGTSKYLALVEEALVRAAALIPLRLVTVGAAPLDHFGVAVEQHPWTEASEAQLIAGAHIGIMPLPDEPWERGKCGYKLIQYMATGLPVIASPVGVNTDIVTPDVGILATTTEEWVAALVALGTDEARRVRLGHNGIERVETEFSTRAVGPQFTAALADAAGIALG